MLSEQGNTKDVSATPPASPKCCVVLNLVLMCSCRFLNSFSLKCSLDSLENKWFITYNNERGSDI